jgi:hypothetical protein
VTSAIDIGQKPQKSRGGMLLGIVALGLWLLQATAAQSPTPSVKSPTDAERQRQQRLKNLLEPAKKQLEKVGIPFDPFITIDDDWRERIDPEIWKLPEMKKNLRVTESLHGIYLADTLLVGERVKLDGNTVLIVRELTPDDENRNLDISGHGDFYLFIIGEPRRVRFRGIRGVISVATTGRCAIVGSVGGYSATFRCSEHGFFRG